MNRTLPGHRPPPPPEAEHDEAPNRWTGAPHREPPSSRVNLARKAVNPKVPIAAFGTAELSAIISWFADEIGHSLPPNVSLAFAAVIGTLIAYYIPFRTD